MDVQASESVREPGRVARMFDDLWNPILVKEVRQSLRGKFFRIGFALTLAALTIASIVMVVAMGDELSTSEGRTYVFGVFVCLAVAVLGLVPYSAFFAMGSEWEENTFDLLIISNLRPRQIVMGKLLSAGTQTLLYYSAFTPFVVFAFLLRGVDLIAVVVLLGGAFVLSLGLSCVALMFSTLTKVKFLRLAFMAFLTTLLVAAINVTALSSEELLRNPGSIRHDEFKVGFAFFLLGVGIVSAFCFLTACNMLSHPEENRSTGLRILTIVTGVLVMSLLTYASTHGMPADREVFTIFGIILTVAASLPMIFFATEPDRLGRRVAPRVPRNPLLALLIAPLLPGGGRGLLLYFFELAAILTFTVAGHASQRMGRQSLLDHGLIALVALMVYLIVFIGLPSRVMASHARNTRVRIVTRAWIPALVLISTFLPALIGFFIKDDALAEVRHAGNPAYFMNLLWVDYKAAPPAIWITLLTLFGLTLLLNLPRLYYAFAEVWRASSARVARERERDAARNAETLESAVPQP